MRTFVRLLFLLGSLATVADLLLLGHFEDNWQLIPLILLGLGLIALGWLRFLPGPRSLRAFQGTMGLFAIAGCLGLYFHYQGNMEFELEMYPSMKGLQLFWESIRGATPALAPAALIQLGLLGLASTCRHPAADANDPLQGGSQEV